MKYLNFLNFFCYHKYVDLNKRHLSSKDQGQRYKEVVKKGILTVYERFTLPFGRIYICMLNWSISSRENSCIVACAMKSKYVQNAREIWRNNYSPICIAFSTVSEFLP